MRCPDCGRIVAQQRRCDTCLAKVAVEVERLGTVLAAYAVLEMAREILEAPKERRRHG